MNAMNELNKSALANLPRWIEPQRAAEIMTSSLGQDIDHWKDFVKMDALAARMSVGKDGSSDHGDHFMWRKYKRVYCCTTAHLFKYISSQNPQNNGLPIGGIAIDESECFVEFSVSPVTDVTNGLHWVVHYFPMNSQIDSTMLTFDEARKFAKQLLTAAWNDGLPISATSIDKGERFVGFSVNSVHDLKKGLHLEVHHYPLDSQIDSSTLTVDEARKLAQQLLEAAHYCETHMYDRGIGAVRKRIPNGQDARPLKQRRRLLGLPWIANRVGGAITG